MEIFIALFMLASLGAHIMALWMSRSHDKEIEELRSRFHELVTDYFNKKCEPIVNDAEQGWRQASRRVRRIPRLLSEEAKKAMSESKKLWWEAKRAADREAAALKAKPQSETPQPQTRKGQRAM